MTLAAAVRAKAKDHPMVLTIDIETSPHLAWTFSTFKTTISPDMIVEPSRILCFAAKWRHERRIRFHSEHHDGHDAMIAAAWSLLDEADAVIGYNSRGFDVKHLHREFVLADMAPPSPHKDIDLLTVSKSRFKWSSNKLDHVASELGVGSKLKHQGFDLWRRCIDGDERAWATMKRYNVQDVRLTEAVYERLLPWIKNHPHAGLFGAASDGCPKCGSLSRTATKQHVTGAAAYPGFRCDDCGTPYRLTRSLGATTGTRAI